MTNKMLLIFITLLTSNVFAAGGGTGTISDLKSNAVNFILLFGFLGWKLKKPMSEMFTKNAEDVKSLFGLAEEKSKEAQIRLEEYKKKLDNLDAEKEKILKEARLNAEKFSKEHKIETDALIERLKEDAIARTESERVQMSRALSSTLLDAVIDKVKTKVTSDKSLQEKATKKLVSQI